VQHAFGGQEFWDERYRSQTRIWSDRPNAALVGQIADLPPGTALDVGAGEGADARWLADRGWRVTALDISPVALDRAAAGTAEHRPDLVDRIEWLPADVVSWDPGARRFDLVCAHYFQTPPEHRTLVFARMAGWVAGGGTLLIVGHHPTDLQTSAHRPPMPEVFYTAEDVAALLDPAHWTILASDAPGRTVTDPDGNEITVRDAVLRARRTPPPDRAGPPRRAR
jgi:SAM-dependent methyltransferase